MAGTMHRTDSPSLLTPRKKICAACDVNDIEWKCIPCNMLICFTCMKGHQKFPATQTHEIKPVQAVAEEIITTLKQDRDKYRIYETEIINRLTKVRQYKDYIGKMKTKIKKEIDSCLNSSKKKLVQKLEHEADNLKKDIDKAVRGETEDIVDQAVNDLGDQLEKLKLVSLTLTELIEKKDYVQIIHNFGDDQSPILPKVIYSLSKHDMTLKLEINLQPTNFEYLEDIYIGDLEIAHSDFQPEGSKEDSRPVSRSSASYYSRAPSARHNSRPLTLYRLTANPLQDLNNKMFHYEYSVKLAHSSTRITVIGNDLYCPGRDVHLVSCMSTTGHIKSSLCHASMRYPMAVAEADNSIIVACDEGYGLMEFDSNGSGFISTIAKGNFCDVMYNGEELYALECTVGKVMIYMKNDAKKWECKKEVTIEYITSSNQDTLLIHKGKIFVSASRNKCVYVYGRNGTLCNTYRSYALGNGAYSSSWHILKLCCIDAQGSLLIADQTEGEVLVVERDDRHSKLQFNVGVTPTDVLLADDGTLWLAEDKLIRAFRSR